MELAIALLVDRQCLAFDLRDRARSSQILTYDSSARDSFKDVVGELSRGQTPPPAPPLRGEGSPALPSLAGKGVGGLGFPNSPTVSSNVEPKDAIAQIEDQPH
jgi:hypothetical protein